MSNLAALLTAGAAERPNHQALVLGDATLNYAELDESSARVAGLLAARGVEIGDRVGVMLPNILEFPVVYFGILRAGGVVVPMNPLLKAREIAYHLQDSGAKALFAWADFEEAARAGAEGQAEVISVTSGEFGEVIESAEPRHGVVDTAADATAVILYTSGTTGTPKGAELTHHNLLENVRVTRKLFGLTRDDVILGALPLFHAFGQTCALNGAIAAGATLTLIRRFEPRAALELVQRDRVTVFEGVPTMFSAMLHVPDREAFDVSSLRLCVSGGAALPVEVLHGFEEAFDAQVLEGYGLSETSPVASFNRPDRPVKPGSIGTPIEGVEMKIVDDRGDDLPSGGVGEIVIRGHNVMKGYWRREEATREAIRDGWFHTGDVATIDEDGYFFIVDRKKDMIIRGGYNIYPREIEEVFHAHPDVREVAVVGIPHEELGEEVGAAVVLKAGADADAETLKAFVRSQVAAYKYPRHVWLVDALPVGATGKILKREIDVPAGLVGRATT